MNYGLLSVLLVFHAIFAHCQSVELQNPAIIPSPLSAVEVEGHGSIMLSMVEVSGKPIESMALTIDVNLSRLSLRNEDVSLITGSLLEYFKALEYDHVNRTIHLSQYQSIPENILLTATIPVRVEENSPSTEPLNGFSAIIHTTDENIDAEGSISIYTYTNIMNTNVDSDGDGVTDAAEVVGGMNPTNPTNPCSFNYEDVSMLATDGGDCDGDGVSNADEINGPDNAVGGNDSTDVNDPCSFHLESRTLPVTAITDCDGDGVESDEDPDDQDPCIPLNCGQLEIPNGFTPNGDDINDAFVITGLEAGTTLRVDIFNRWGTRVFESSNYKNNWKGTAESGITVSKESKLPEGTYYFIVTEVKSSGEEVLHKGYVFLSY